MVTLMINWKKELLIALPLTISLLISLIYPLSSQARSVNNEIEIILKGKIGTNNNSFGMENYEDGSRGEPSSIATDSKGNIYIADYLNDRIQKFDGAGRHVLTIKLSANPIKKTIIDDLALDVSNNLYVSCWRADSIYIFSPDGNYLRTISVANKNLNWNHVTNKWDGGRVQIERIAIDRENNLFIESGSAIIRLNAKGDSIQKWAPAIRHRAPKYLFAEDFFVVLPNEEGSIASYYYDGTMKFTGACGSLRSKKVGETGCLLPWAIDKDKYSYWFDQIDKRVFAVKKDQSGNIVRKILIPDIDYCSNIAKYDQHGNLFVLFFDGTLNLFKLIKVSAYYPD